MMVVELMFISTLAVGELQSNDDARVGAVGFCGRGVSRRSPDLFPELARSSFRAQLTLL